MRVNVYINGQIPSESNRDPSYKEQYKVTKAFINRFFSQYRVQALMLIQEV